MRRTPGAWVLALVWGAGVGWAEPGLTPPPPAAAEAPPPAADPGPLDAAQAALRGGDPGAAVVLLSPLEAALPPGEAGARVLYLLGTARAEVGDLPGAQAALTRLLAPPWHDACPPRLRAVARRTLAGLSNPQAALEDDLRSVQRAAAALPWAEADASLAAWQDQHPDAPPALQAEAWAARAEKALEGGALREARDAAEAALTLLPPAAAGETQALGLRLVRERAALELRRRAWAGAAALVLLAGGVGAAALRPWRSWRAGDTRTLGGVGVQWLFAVGLLVGLYVTGVGRDGGSNPLGPAEAGLLLGTAAGAAMVGPAWGVGLRGRGRLAAGVASTVGAMAVGAALYLFAWRWDCLAAFGL